jgi:hypothetical protein
MSDKKAVPTKSKPKSAKKGAADKKQSAQKKDNILVPPLVDFLLTFSRILMIGVGLVTLAISVINGVSPMVAAFRAGVGMIVVGLLMYIVSWAVSHGSLEAHKAERQKREQEMRKLDSDNTTMEIQA